MAETKNKKNKAADNKCKKEEANRLERRRAERLPIPLKVKYKIKGTAGCHKHIPWEDISGLGLRFCLNKPLPPQKELEIALYISGDPKPIEAIGRVAWCREFDKGEFKAGIEFTKIKDHFRFTELICRSMLELSSMKI